MAGETPKTQGGRPAVVAVVLAALFVGLVLGQMQNLLGGMHLEREESVRISSLTGGPVKPVDPRDFAAVIAVWDRWDCEQLSIAVPDEATVACTKADRQAAEQQTRPVHESPRTIAGMFVAVDAFAFVPLYGFLLLMGIASLRLGVNPGWLTLLAWIRRFAIVAIVADEVENLFTWLVIDTDGTTLWLGWVLMVAARAKWWLVAAAVLGLVFTAAFGLPSAAEVSRSEELRKYARGVSAIRVSLLCVTLVGLMFFGPLLGDQLADLVRRWDPIHGGVAGVMAVTLGVFVWLTSHRISRRLEHRTMRWQPDPDSPADRKLQQELRAAPENEENRVMAGAVRDRQERGQTLRRRVTWTVLAGGVLGAVGWMALGGLGKGLLIPAAFVGLLAATERWLPTPPDVAPDPSNVENYRVPDWLPQTLGAAIPVIVGSAVVGAAVPEFLLDAARPPLVVPAICAVAAMALLELVRRRIRARPSLLESVKLGRGVGAGVLLFAVVVVVRGAPSISSSVGGAWLIAIGVVFVALGYVLYDVFDVAAGEDYHGRLFMQRDGIDLWRLIGGGIVLGAVVWLLWSQIGAPVSMGGAAVLILFVLVLGILAEAATRFADLTVAPKIFRYMNLQRTPVFALVGAWFVIMAAGFSSPEFHAVEVTGRTETPSTDTALGLSMQDVYDGWSRRNQISSPASVPPGSRVARPLVIVSAWGGGIRAAVWTALVMDCAFEHHADSGVCRSVPGVSGESSASGAIAAASGISGGSMGLAEYAATLDEGGMTQSWIRERLGPDFLSPTMTRLAFVDLPLTLIGGSDLVRDRGDVLQDAWEQPWGEGGGVFAGGMLDQWTSADRPLLVFNSASMNDACSVNVSPLDAAIEVAGRDDCTSLAGFDPERRTDAAAAPGSLVGTIDLVDLLCRNEDVPISAAALMSARFPFISPAGLLERGKCSTYPADVYTTDGGQLELSGTLTAFQLWEALEPQVQRYNATHDSMCIVPVMIHMENGFNPDLNTASGSPPIEWIDAVRFSLTDAKGGLVENARQRAALAFTGPMTDADGGELIAVDSGGDPVSRYAYVRTRGQPGTTAPLGWTLSEQTFDDLENQLRLNDDQFDVIEQWLSGSLFCLPTPSSGQNR